MKVLKGLLQKFHQVSLRGKILLALVTIMILFLYQLSFSENYLIAEKFSDDQVEMILQGSRNYFDDKLENMTYLFKTLPLEMETAGLNNKKISELNEKIAELNEKIADWPKEYQPDILFITDLNGKVLYSKNCSNPKSQIYDLKITRKALKGNAISGMEVLDSQFLKMEGLINTEHIVPKAKTSYLSEKGRKALAMITAQPLYQEEKLVGLAVIGKMINDSNFIVDDIGMNFGVNATVFLDGVSVSTNVLDRDGKRAIGTLLPEPIYNEVVLQGQKYARRNFVSEDWYLNSYEPLKDVDGLVIGSLYIGINEQPLLDIKKGVNNEIRVTLVIGVAIFVIGILWIYGSIIKPIQDISQGAMKFAKGNFATRFNVATPNRCWEIMNCGIVDCKAYNNQTARCWLMEDTRCRFHGLSFSSTDTCFKCEVFNLYSGNEIDRLTDAINYMVDCIDERTQALESVNQELEVKNDQLLESRDELEIQKNDLLKLNTKLQESMKALDDNHNIIYALAVAVEAKDPYTRGHSERVAYYSLHLAECLGIGGEQLEILKGAALLHDIGKIGISDSILNKPDALDEMEFKQIKNHPGIGERICHSLKFAQEMLPIIRSHHEHYNGRGYPDALVGADIPFLARIVAIADAFDAMTSDRPYRPGLPFEEAVHRLEEGAGTQWDPELISEFIKVIKKELLNCRLEEKIGDILPVINYRASREAEGVD